MSVEPLLEDPGLRERLGKNAQRATEEAFSPRRFAAAVIAIADGAGSSRGFGGTR